MKKLDQIDIGGIPEILVSFFVPGQSHKQIKKARKKPVEFLITNPVENF